MEASEEEPVSPELSLHRASSRLLHTASSVLSGGAAVLPQPSATDREADGSSESLQQHVRRPLLRRQSTRALRQNQVMERVIQELLRRFRLRIFFFFVALVTLALAMVGLLLWLAYAEFVDADVPCDQPLWSYLLVAIGVGQCTGGLRQRVRNWRASTLIFLSFIPPWLVIGWGFYLIHSCRTCQRTNPNLYYATKYFLCMQVAFTVSVTLFCSVGLTAVYLFLVSIQHRLQPGSQKAVERLPKLQGDSPDLIDPEDGKVMECPICLETLQGTTPCVRTDCGHCFHEPCLLKWAKHHLDCPMCRTQIGEPDEPEP